MTLSNRINELLTDIYDEFNSACIIDFDRLTIETPEQTLEFTNADYMRVFILQEIRESASCLK